MRNRPAERDLMLQMDRAWGDKGLERERSG